VPLTRERRLPDESIIEERQRFFRKVPITLHTL